MTVGPPPRSDEDVDSNALRAACIRLFAAAATLTCGLPAPQLPAKYEIAPNAVSGPDWTLASIPVLLLADNHTQHLYGDPSWMRGPAVAKIVPAITRPVQLDLYGQDLMRWTLAFNDDGQKLPVLHLGGALGASCVVEMSMFFTTMALSQEPWLMAPGNDGFFFGNAAAVDGAWERACQRGGGPVHAHELLAEYLRVLAKRYGVTGVDRPDGSWTSSSLFLSAVQWHKDAKQSSRSWVVQLADITAPATGTRKAYALLFDTSEYEVSPTLGGQDNAGVAGDILADQLAAARALLAPHAQEHPLVVVMGHHPYASLTVAGKLAIDAIRREQSVPLYVSAHTRRPRYFVNGTVNGTEAASLELSLGALLESSGSFRSLSVWAHADHARVSIESPSWRFDELWTSTTKSPKSDAAWEAKLGDPRYTMGMLGLSEVSANGHAETELADGILAELAYSIYQFPTTSSQAWPPGAQNDAQVMTAIKDAMMNAPLEKRLALAQALQRFDEDRISADSASGHKHRDYRLWQARWASERVWPKKQVPDARDAHVVFPTTH